MRVRKRKNIAKKNTALVVFFLLPLIGVFSYGSVVLYILYDINSFTYELEPPNKRYFTERNEINMSRLEEMAEIFDYRNRKINSPVGYPVKVTFKNRSYTYNAIEKWHHTDNGAAHASYALAAACFKYKTALDLGDDEMLKNASSEVKFFVNAFAKLIAAPNGGLGKKPNGEWYPGIISRFAVSYQDAKKYHPFMLEDHPRHHNGTGKYSNWRVRWKTSRDEVSGMYLGWASVLKFIDPSINEDSEYAYNTTRIMIGQVIHHWKEESNWLVLDHDGSPTGSDINTSPWKLIALRIAATAYPKTYGALYKYTASKMLRMGSANMGQLWNAGMEYFAFMGACKSMFPLIILEDNPQLRYLYIKNFEQKFYPIVRYHRNAFFNTVHLAFLSLLKEEQQTRLDNPKYDYEDVTWDVLDQLWRFHTSNWCPVRNYNLTERPHSTRSTSENPEMRKKVLEPSRQKWLNFIENSPSGWMYSWMIDLFSMEDKVYEMPRTVSEYPSQHNVWQTNPMQKEGGNPNGNGLEEPPGTSYTMVYWMCRAFEII
ncbi:MAG: hypothetical protein ACOC44_10340 [Promethearchaeia archaeon]